MTHGKGKSWSPAISDHSVPKSATSVAILVAPPLSVDNGIYEGRAVTRAGSQVPRHSLAPCRPGPRGRQCRATQWTLSKWDIDDDYDNDMRLAEFGVLSCIRCRYASATAGVTPLTATVECGSSLFMLVLGEPWHHKQEQWETVYLCQGESGLDPESVSGSGLWIWITS